MMRLLLNTQLTQHASSASNCMPVQCRTSLIPVAAPSISSRCYDAFSYNARDLRSRDCRSDRLAVVARATDTDSSNGDEEDADQMWDADTSEEELLDEDFSNVKILGTEEDDTLMWADYLYLNVEGVLVDGLQASEQEGTEAMPSSEAESPAAIALRNLESLSTEPPPTEAVVNAEEAHYNSLLGEDLRKDPKLAYSSAARYFGGKTLPLRPLETPMNEWDLRARMEKRARQQREQEAWLARNREEVGRYRAVASDWRNDVRVFDTGDPNDPEYREWTMKEIWELIVLGGRTADPRDVTYTVREPGSRADFVEEGFVQHPDIPDWLEMQGRIIKDEQEEEVIDRNAEVALLASEFSDFDDDFVVAEQGADSLDDGEF